QLIRYSLPDGVSHEQLNELQALTDETIRDLRRLTSALRPTYLEELGLVTALSMLVRETSDSSGIDMSFTYKGKERRLPDEVELAFYRMIQEGLNNITRHSRANSADLKFHFESGEVVLILRDDGCGFVVPESPAEFAPVGHFGLLGMNERAELICARLSIKSKPGRGTWVEIIWSDTND
ncbi:MAG: hypothetical protein MUO76_13365, partial [Anaerolineaceae bacterium]|nr:hypothetical protein [Anaerolineaceae bacterium]